MHTLYCVVGWKSDNDTEDVFDKLKVMAANYKIYEYSTSRGEEAKFMIMVGGVRVKLFGESLLREMKALAWDIHCRFPHADIKVGKSYVI